MKQLNIPIEQQTTRHAPRRVVWLTGFICASLLVAGVGFNLFMNRDETSHFGPINRTATVRVLNRPHTQQILADHLGSMPVLPGTSLRMIDLLRFSKREFSIHFSQNSITGVSFDGILPTDMQEQLSRAGYTVLTAGHLTLVLPEEQAVNPAVIRISTQTLSPLTHAELFLRDTRPISVTITSKGIFIRSAQKRGYSAPASQPTAGQTLVGFASTSGESTDTNILSTLLSTLPAPLPDQVTQPAHVMLATDKNGLAYSLSIKTSELPIEQLAQIGHEIMNRRTLSTTALTLKDGSQIEEIRSNPNKITSDVTNDGGSSFIRLSNTKGDVVRLVKTMDTVSISNRDISSTISAFSAPVNCIRHPNAFLDLTAFLDLFNDNGAFNQPTNTFPIFARYFSSFAQNTKRIGLCW